MKNGKMRYLFTTVILVVSLVLMFFLTNGSSIKASEDGEIGTAEFDPDLPTLPGTEADLHTEEDITIPQMESYMAGTAYQAPLARANGKITGGMTAAEYNSLYASLNQQQNDAWNATYNFRPETNVVHVSDWATFKAAYENNAVSKIILDADIYYGTSTRVARTESIEIDGQGHLLEMRNGSVNVDGLSSLSNFGKAFSDVPVFHMHDIQIANNTGYGAVEGSLGNAWAFVNGDGEFEENRGLWRYRIGNVTTPYDASQATNNQRVGGRLINGNYAEISVWGYNKVVTGAENFYTGGMTYEPYTYYKGEIADYNYSAIWFIQSVGNTEGTSNRGLSTGTRKFDIGEGSFVYLHNTNTGTGYPGVYEHYDELIVGKNATYNANTAGSAVSFNQDNAKFTAMEGATVNLLSRNDASGYPTLVIGSSNSTHTGGSSSPDNIRVEFQPKTKVFIVGNNSTGAVGYRGSSATSQIILDSPETFDIRNTRTNTGTSRAFLGDSSTSRGSHVFTVKNSDISIWENSVDMDGAPTYDYSNVGDFTVTNGVANGTVTSTDGTLASQYTRPNFKRISGMNSTPELIWTPVTDADYSQRAQILIGYTAVGGSDPFDPNGDAYTKPVYADATRKAYVDYIDTLGNTYTGVSTSDSFVHWAKADHTTPGFQIADQDMKGTPYRASLVNGTLTPYRTGIETPTTVIDVTPPEPAELIGNKLTNATKQLKAENLEPNAKVFLSINGGSRIAAGTVGADGKWSYDLSAYMNTGETVSIYLQDSAAAAPADIVPAPPSTNSADGNINPSPNDLTYRDATFKKAAVYTVVDVLPDVPAMSKSVKSYRSGTEVSNTQVGDTLVYTLTAKNNKAATFETDWSNVKITDTLPNGLEFDPATSEVTLNGTVITSPSGYTYDSTTRLLTIPVGNLNSQEEAVVTFEAKVSSSSVGQTIVNKAKVEGASPRETLFTAGPENPQADHETYWAESSDVSNPGGSIYGVLELVSAPAKIDFGLQETGNLGRYRAENPEYDKNNTPLVVGDSRATLSTWYLTAKVTKVLTSEDDSTYTLPNALKYKNDTSEEVLGLNESRTLVSHTYSMPNSIETKSDNGEKAQNLSESKDATSRVAGNNGIFNVSQEEWENKNNGFILELNSTDYRKMDDYTATILFTVSDTP